MEKTDHPVEFEAIPGKRFYSRKEEKSIREINAIRVI